MNFIEARDRVKARLDAKEVIDCTTLRFEDKIAGDALVDADVAEYRVIDKRVHLVKRKPNWFLQFFTMGKRG